MSKKVVFTVSVSITSKMRRVCYLIFLITLLGYDDVQAMDTNLQSIKDVIEQLVSDFREELGDSTPLVSQNITIPTNKYISGYIDLQDAKLTGFKNFKLDIKYLLFDTVPDKMNFSVESLYFDTKYQAELYPFNIELLKIFGSGKFSFLAKNVQMLADIDLHKKIIKNSVFSIENFDIVITGFRNDSSTDVSTHLTEAAKEMMRTHPTQISTFIEDRTNQLINFVVSEIKSALPFPTLFRNEDVSDASQWRAFIDLIDTISEAE